MNIKDLKIGDKVLFNEEALKDNDLPFGTNGNMRAVAKLVNEEGGIVIKSIENCIGFSYGPTARVWFERFNNDHHNALENNSWSNHIILRVATLDKEYLTKHLTL